ncbi:serine protease [Streptomyces sp. V1I1]|uniref:trypsin-like serine peptidase n=1 Tax=Streptomyces sp. V1I1 TaxID=3042272 RepID=UPI00278B99FB|nr:peptidase [Streptomyces sp. V1I1]MDQ0942815.1 V8-like Glu-specific endopeptidase [Streptomyces sp. V1I1]
MRRHRTPAGILLTVATLLAGALSATAADAAPAPSPAPTVFKQQQTQGFWTAERMRNATPLDLLPLTRDGLKALGTPKRGGKETAIPPTAVSPTAFPQAGGPWTGGGAVVKTSGRVFFSFQGRTASCSGNSVTSQNGSTVITAGHCVKYQGSWHTNWVFVPAYNNGQAPYGQWSATKTFSTDQWVASEDINYDVGAAVVAPLGGKKLAETVGAQGLSFNGGYNKAMYAFGFPAASPYDGTKLIYCSGNSSKDFLFSKDHSLGCNMTGGSSGGPWFTSFSEATGTGLQASVNSFGYTFLPNRMFGPYFGNEAKAVYDKAQVS